VVGLGNPGDAYRKTRHNAGFMVLDGIVEHAWIDGMSFPGESKGFLSRLRSSKPGFKKTSRLFRSIEAKTDGGRCTFTKPMTFMNESGKALASLRTRGVFSDPSELLVVVDDVDLEIGRIRLRARGSAGGHNGLSSIIEHLGTREFARLRIGVGPRPGGDEMVDYVLGSFRPEEWEPVRISLEKAAGIVGAWITGGFDKAQQMVSTI